MAEIILYDSINGSHQLDFVLHSFGFQGAGDLNRSIKVGDLIGAISKEIPSQGGVRTKIDEALGRYNLFSNDATFPLVNTWPRYDETDKRQLGSLKMVARKEPILDKSTPIVSLGSCFAIEIARWLQTNDFNFIVTEPNLVSEGIHASSAKWGTIFNAPSLAQVFSWAFEERSPPMVVYPLNGKYRDPFREDIEYDAEQVGRLENIWLEHLKKSREALLSARVVVATIGLVEVFEYLPTGEFLHRTPWRLNPMFWKERILTVEDNIEFLTQAVACLRRHNPNVEFVFSVSPVPLFRTFRKNVHVCEATAFSKAILRVAIERVCQTLPRCHYMPSFERVMYSGEVRAWDSDYRHINREIVPEIMSIFEQMFCE